jgi:hypothetical protein
MKCNADGAVQSLLYLKVERHGLVGGVQLEPIVARRVEDTPQAGGAETQHLAQALRGHGLGFWGFRV